MAEIKPATPVRKRRWFQYSLGTLLLFVLICQIACSWFFTRVHRQRHAVEAILKCDGCIVVYDNDDAGRLLSSEPIDAAALTGKPQPPPRETWVERLFGRDFLHRAVTVQVPLARVDEVVPNLKRLPCLQNVRVFLPDNGRDGTCDVVVEKIKRELPGVQVIGVVWDRIDS
jgi:DNA-binding transcriptional LysR family regulator